MFVRNPSTIDVLFAGKNGLLVVERPQYIDYHHTPTIPTNPAKKANIPPCFIIPVGDEMLIFPHWQAKKNISGE